MSDNPYQAPAVASVAAAETDVESTRRKYLNHEASVKGVGSLYILGGVVAGISLIAFPIGTLIGAYILYLLLGGKGKVVFSPEYQEVIAQTPHIRYRTSKVVWALLIVLLLIIVLGLVALFLTPRAV